MRRKAVFLIAGLLILSMATVWADGAKPASPDRAYVNSIIDSLVKSGVLTQEQADQMKSDATTAAKAAAKAQPPKRKSWTDTLSVGGYTQGEFHYYTDAPNADHPAGKPSNEFLVRRARIVIKASPTDRAHFGFEGDWGKGGTKIIDADLTYDLTADHLWRADLGEQYVPFGFEVPQSSSVRIPLEFSYMGDKEWPDQHDTGLVLYYTSPQDRHLFAASKSHNWGAGDYGNFAIGAFDGQGGVNQEVNSNKTLVVRVAKPFAVGNGGYAELGASYWDGKYFSSKLGMNVDDHIWGVHGYLAPHPFGLQAEYESGKTEGADVTGWYAMGLWHASVRDIVYLRYASYQGRKKGGGLTPFDRTGTTLGIAHDLDKATRLTLEYDWENVDAEPIIQQAAYHNDQLAMRLMVKY